MINDYFRKSVKMENDQDDLLDYLKLDPDHHEKIASLIPKETWYEQIIRYGLYIGAVFQMVCILVRRKFQFKSDSLMFFHRLLFSFLKKTLLMVMVRVVSQMKKS